MGMSPSKEPAGAGDHAADRELTPAELTVVEDLVCRARAPASALNGPGGLLKAMSKVVVEARLEEEMSDQPGYDKHAIEGRNRANSRNGDGRRRPSPTTAVRWRSRFPATGTAPSSRSWFASVSVGWVRSTKSF